MSETHSNAFKMEADEKRQQAAILLAEAEKLDPTPEEKPKKTTKVSRSAESGEFVSKDVAKKHPRTTVTERK